jgi:hypothetical protein
MTTAKQVAAADKLISLKHENQNDPWIVIDAIIEYWRKTRPTEYKSFIIETEKAKGTRANVYGVNKKEGLRYTVDCPQWVHDVTRRLYDPEELVMGKEFWQLFWKRYPVFRVSEKS